jgi:ribose transport system substrate-binding protein
LVFAASARAAEPKRLVFLVNNSSEFWLCAKQGLEAAQTELKLGDAGLKAVMLECDGTPKSQLDKLRQLGTQTDVAGLAISALDADNVAIAEAMRDLKKKGVQVVCVDSDVNRQRLRDARSYYLGTDNVRGGKCLGIACRELLLAKGKTAGGYVQFVGRTGSQNAQERMNGFTEMVGSQFKQLDRMADDGNRRKAQENVRNAIGNHPDLAALVGIWSYNAPAIADVVKEKNAAGKFVVVCFDAEPLAVQYMGEGRIDAMVVQNPYMMGYQSMRLLKAMIAKDESVIKEMFPGQGPDADIFDTGLKVVAPDSSATLKAEQFDKSVQFVPLSEFKAWLDKYGLKGS